MSERDELRDLIEATFDDVGIVYDTITDAILAAGYVKMPEPVIEWGVGSKWGRHAYGTKESAEENIELHHSSGELARLVKRDAGTKAGPWEEVA